MELAAEIFFWIFLAIIAYVTLGYPIVVFGLNLFYHKPHKAASIEPKVTVTMASRNEINNISTKLDSCMELNYPKNLLEVIVGSDGSTDGSLELLKKYSAKGIRILDLPRMGKALVNNSMVSEATGDIVIDTSSSGYFEPDFIKHVVKHFSDPDIGCVTGESYFKNLGSSSTSSAEGSYFRLEWKLRQLESNLGILCVGNGGVLAFRRSLYHPINPASDVDNMVPLQIVRQGCRVIHESAARTLGETAVDSSQRQIRGRIRQVTRSQQDIYRGKELLNPFKNPKYAFVLYSRRLLRWWTPFFALGAFVANMGLLHSTFYSVLFAIQLLFYLSGIIGIIVPRLLPRLPGILTLPSNFISINYAFFLGTINALRRRQIVKW